MRPVHGRRWLDCELTCTIIKIKLKFNLTKNFEIAEAASYFIKKIPSSVYSLAKVIILLKFISIKIIQKKLFKDVKKSIRYNFKLVNKSVKKNNFQ